jgi:serine/threonine-protein kinase PknG
MVDGNDIKLIDLGGVRRADDPGGDVYGTVGYSAPEAAQEPSPSSDLYSVGRTLAVLLLEFKGFQAAYKHSLPPQDEHPVLEKHDVLYRFLRKATHADPQHRFADAEEMADQLAGVLQEVAAVEHGVSKPRESTVFSADSLLYQAPDLEESGLEPLLEEVDHRALPVPKLDTHDPAAAILISYANIPNLARRLASMRLACHKFPDSIQAPLHVGLTMLEEKTVSADLDRYLPGLEGTWQGTWLTGCRALRTKDWDGAMQAFSTILSEFPGELAPKFGLAIALERARRITEAAHQYSRILAIDPVFLSAVFGLARCHRREGQCQEAATLLGTVPISSALYQRAQVARVHCLLEGAHNNFDRILQSGVIAQSLRLGGKMEACLNLEIQTAALNLCLCGRTPPSQALLLDNPLNETALRLNIERTLRQLARLTNDSKEKLELVWAANQIRPVTLF